jgi:predicted adenylyl cyclase CyaB
VREVELTIQVLEDFNDVIEKVEGQGFLLVEKYYMKDYYMIHKSVDLSSDNYDILKKCLLIRKIVDDNPKNYLTYKNKNYDENGKIISQNKIKTKIDSVDDVKNMLEIVDHVMLFEIENNSAVYKKDNVEFVVQNITNPKGVFIEIEANEEELMENNDENIKEILKEKLDKLQLRTTGDYEVKKAIIALNNIKQNKENL